MTPDPAPAHDLETVEWLDSAEGRALVSSLDAPGAGDALAIAERLRAAGHSPAHAAAAMTQARLRDAARPRLGDLVDDLLLTDEGAQQATRTVVADRHAARMVASGVRAVADLGCGMGADALAFARVGLDVTAVEHDPVTAAVARANLRRAGHLEDTAASDRPPADTPGPLGRGGSRVVLGDALTVAATLEPDVALWADPARRRAGRRIQDPAQWSPPLDAVLALAGPPGARRAVGVKVAPGIDHAALPPDAEVEFVSVDGDLVEAAIWLGPLCLAPGRVAVVVRQDRGPAGTARIDVLRDGAVDRPGGGTADAPVRMAGVRELDAFLYEPDDAVLRAGLVAAASDLLGPAADAGVVSPGIAYLTGESAELGEAAPFLSGYRILETHPLTSRILKQRLRALGATSVAVKKRGVSIDPEALRRELGFGGKAGKRRRAAADRAREVTVVVTPVAGSTRALLVEPL